MYLKAHERFKDGKRHVYYCLTESLRISRKRVAQRTVLHLGELNTTQVERWQRTIEAVHEDGQRRQMRLFTGREGQVPVAAEDVAEPQRLAPRLSSLQGTTVGLIDNHKRNANVYLEELGRLLQEGYGVSRVITYRKISQSLPTPGEVLDQLASECDAIIHAVAD